MTDLAAQRSAVERCVIPVDRSNACTHMADSSAYPDLHAGLQAAPRCRLASWIFLFNKTLANECVIDILEMLANPETSVTQKLENV
jgi:hypothetical protein